MLCVRAPYAFNYHCVADQEVDTALTTFDAEFPASQLDECIQAWGRKRVSLASLQLLRSLIDDYQKRQASTIHRVRTRVLEQLEIQHLARLKEDLGQFRDIVEKTVPGTAVSAAQFLDSQTGDFVVCSHTEAIKILSKGPLRVPLLILKALSEDNKDRVVPKESLQDFLEALRTYPTLDAHYFEVDDVARHPISKEASVVIDDFKKGDRGPINLLNVQGPIQNPPICLDDWRFNILETIFENYYAGKREREPYRDLSTSSRFYLLGSEGSFSLPHIDRHGVMTSVLCKEGEKLWILWPNRGVEGVEEWAKSASDPDGAPIGILLEEGDLLIQPSGTVHAPTSVTDCWMTGTMHWDILNLPESMHLTELELEYRHITNEDPAKEFRSKIKKIEELWRGQMGPWQWPEAGADEFSRRRCNIDRFLKKKKNKR